MCSGHGGTRGRKKNKGNLKREVDADRQNYLRGGGLRDCLDTAGKNLSLKRILSPSDIGPYFKMFDSK